MSERKYIVATDVGGTCTDTVVIAAGEPFHIGKALSTPPNFANGVLDSISVAANSMDLSVEQLFAQRCEVLEVEIQLRLVGTVHLTNGDGDRAE